MPHCYNFLFFLKLGGATLRHIKLRHYGITAYSLITALRHYGIYGLRFLITVFTSRAVTVNGISTATIASTSIPTPITQTTNTSNDVQAFTTASSINTQGTNTSINAQGTNTSINGQEDYISAFSDTQAASNTSTLQALQEADEIKVKKLVRSFINTFVKNLNLWKEFKEVVDSTSYPVNIHKQEQPYNDTQVKASNVS